MTEAPKDEHHWAAGVGMAWEHFQLDFAIDYSDTVVTISSWGIVKF